MGRPKQIEPRSQQLNLSFSASELEAIKARAHALGMRPAHLGRALLLEKKAPAAGHNAPANNTWRLIQSQLIRLGNNLNQMVRHLHQTGDPLPLDLEPLLNDIRRLITKISE
jgi:Bacterial mobilisation protein (MobC)